MNTLQDIFKRIEGKEWDWFGKPKRLMKVNSVGIGLWNGALYSLPDLLANKSWCKAVWGERWNLLSLIAFKTLQQEGKQSCLDYITKTMI